MLRVALIGCGRIGKLHAQTIRHSAQATLACVHDAAQSVADELAALCGTRTAATTDEAIAASDAVLIASPTDTHADLIEASVAAGKPVFCEKPIDLDLARVDQCARKIAASGVPVQIGFNRRFDPGHRRVRDLYRDGHVGDLYQIIITSRDPAPPPPEYLARSGGLFRDMTIHDFDLARFLFDEEPTEVTAIGNALVDPAVATATPPDIDTAMILLRTASGRQCHINNCRRADYGYDQRVELHGSEGMLISGNRRPTEVAHYSRQSTSTAEPYWAFFAERYADSYQAELEAFFTVIEQGTQPEVGFDDGRRALLLAEAAVQSMRESRTIDVHELDAGSS